MAMAEESKLNEGDTSVVDTRPIPTPLKLQVRRLQYSVAPLIVFLAAAVTAGFLWKRHVGPTGTITTIFSQPGTTVRQGREIMTITEDQGQYIVSYVRQNGGFKPKKDMLVDIRVDGGPGGERMVQAEIFWLRSWSIPSWKRI